jgi:hypothetical protein
MESNAITILAVAVSTAVSQLVNVYRDRQRRKLEVRNRQWDVEDRQAKAAEVLSEIQKNTDISVNAFNQANSVNTKFIKIHQRIDELAYRMRKLETAAELANELANEAAAGEGE